jgi:hypothetical protein
METDVWNWLRSLWKDPADGYEGGMKYFAGGAWNAVYFSATSRYPFGTNIFEEEWDVLVALDACRVDALREVAPEYDFIESVESRWSLGSASLEWYCKTFVEAYADTLSETVLLSSNPQLQYAMNGRRPPINYAMPFDFSNWQTVDKEQFQSVRTVFDYEYDNLYWTTPPDIVTDHAVDVARETEYERFVIHYYQPHKPYLAGAYPEKRELTHAEAEPYEAVTEGAKTQAEIREMYLDNLRLVLDSIAELLTNLDAERVVITADHGELFGELGIYGHREGIPHPNLKKVPWVVTSATDERTLTPSVDEEAAPSEEEVQDQLEALGYL